MSGQGDSERRSGTVSSDAHEVGRHLEGCRDVGGDKALRALDRGLTGKTFLVGERYSVADISLYGYTHVAAEGGFARDGYLSILAWLDRVAAQPGHVTIDA